MGDIDFVTSVGVVFYINFYHRVLCIVNSFGSAQVGSRTGIIFNDEINDFLLPARHARPANNEQSAPFANNIEPGKRPMSSMSPTIVVDREGNVKLIIGAAGSTLITSSTAYVRELMNCDDIAFISYLILFRIIVWID